jgi:hypothetical protein
MNILTPEQLLHLNNLYVRYLDQIDIRNRNRYGSYRYEMACNNADDLEQEASTLCYGDTAHTMSECLNGVDA